VRPLLAQYDHLQLVRAKEPFARRKDGRPGPAPKPGKGHGGQIRREADDAVARQRAIRPPQFVDPSLILKVHMHGLAMEGDWEQLGLTLLNTDDDNNIVLFSSTDELSDFAIGWMPMRDQHLQVRRIRATPVLSTVSVVLAHWSRATVSGSGSRKPVLRRFLIFKTAKSTYSMSNFGSSGRRLRVVERQKKSSRSLRSRVESYTTTILGHLSR
tara:strand:- start:1884 stop:2522 length:639 start_codon:yes stop_codon:yes gene_type:complete